MPTISMQKVVIFCLFLLQSCNVELCHNPLLYFSINTSGALTIVIFVKGMKLILHSCITNLYHKILINLSDLHEYSFMPIKSFCLTIFYTFSTLIHLLTGMIMGNLYALC